LFDLQHLNVVAKAQLSSPVTALMVVLPDEEQDTDTSYIVCGCLDGSLHVLDAQSLREVMVMSNQPHAGSRIDSLAFSPLAGASVWLATDADSRLSIWHFDWNLLGAGVQPNLLRLIHLAHLYSTDYRALTNDIDYSPPALATFSPVHAAQVWCVAPSGDRAAICYDFDAERTVAVVPLYHSPASLAMSPDGCALAVGTEDRCVVLVDTQSGEVEEYHGLPDCVAGVTFSASGSALACCSHAEIHVFSG
jgi:WD40 repeat protein